VNRFSWTQHPDLMSRLVAAQNALTAPVDILTFAGMCGSEAELRQHVERYEQVVRDQPVSFAVVFKATGAIVAKAKNRKRARNTVDRKDNEYGSYAHRLMGVTADGRLVNTF
jgi:hypothetical protein